MGKRIDKQTNELYSFEVDIDQQRMNEQTNKEMFFLCILEIVS